MLKHLMQHHKAMGLSAFHLACPSRNSLTSISHSVSQTDRLSLSSCPLAVRDLSLLLPYFSISNLWYLKNEGTLLYLKVTTQPKQDDNINPQLSTRLGHPQGTTSNNFHFTTIHKICYFLVQASPNNLLTYFTMF